MTKYLPKNLPILRKLKVHDEVRDISYQKQHYDVIKV